MGGVSKEQEIPGERGCLNFFQSRLNFQAVVRKVSRWARKTTKTPGSVITF